ncbi:hypothetical protein Pcinc_039682, partial [Petrolisthes cinctipes]
MAGTHSNASPVVLRCQAYVMKVQVTSRKYRHLGNFTYLVRTSVGRDKREVVG